MGGVFLTPHFENVFLIQNKKLWGVTLSFEVDWLSGLGVTGLFLVFNWGGRGPFDPPF